MTPTEHEPETAAHPFAELAEFMALPRLSGLALSADGNRLVTSVATLNPEKTKWQSALWAIDPAGEAAPHRLTRSAPGESGAAFLPDGDLLFVSARPDPNAGKDAPEPVPALWVLPAGGGEARLVLVRAMGVAGLAVAADSGDVAIVADVHPGSESDEQDGQRRKERKDRAVSAILHEEYPVRFWDQDLGPAWPHVFSLGRLPAEGEPVEARDLTPRAGLAIGESATEIDLSPDGRWLVRTVDVPGPGPAERTSRLELIEVATGEARVLAAGDDVAYESPSFSPTGTHVLCVRAPDSTYDDCGDRQVWVIDVASGEGRQLAAELDRWPNEMVWSHDGGAVFVAADDDGHAPVFRIDLATGAVTRLTTTGSHSALQVARDGTAVYALRAGWDHPARPVRLDPTTADQDGVTLPAPGLVEHLPGTLERIEATADDGARIASWLVLPEGASADAPVPLVVWIHGGPISSWNTWSWRWCPWLLAAQGYAVLLPDPAFSTGYGRDFVQRGWGQWGGAPYTDLMAAVDGALARPDLDAERTAAMGGSFGGYMANWVAGHTDRFRAIVTHASLWHLDGFVGATDASYFWLRQFGDPLMRPERYEANSPHRHADAITTPMLVIHGDKDYRVPIGEGLRLWYDLQRRGVESKFLYFPDENHWVLTPGNHTVWYQTVLAFLGEHVLGRDWVRPELL